MPPDFLEQSYLLILNIVGIVHLVLPVIVLHATYLARNGGLCGLSIPGCGR